MGQSQLGALGSGELLIIAFLMGMVLLLALLVVVAAALFFIWGPQWLEEQHRQWHAQYPTARDDRGRG